ncbi:hypothetical protein GVX82_00995 [Patescibacteria group bacterium]|jgi:hypothetical protein|nr:hypothetical protein [Patescibacteria group bacterium]
MEITLNSTHYVCTGGCGGVAPDASVCGTQHCPKEGIPLTECHCTDGRHFAAFEADGVEVSE